VIGATREQPSVSARRGGQVWIATTPVDMRKSFDGLAEVVRSFLGHDPLGGNVFVFRNRTSQRVKILWWDAGGLTIYYKRLERGMFRFPASNERTVAIDGPQLLRLLDGLEIVARRVG
jgi:transposase